MSLSKHELFQQMLEQINLHHQPEYLPYFENGEIEQVIVHKKSKLWSFQFVFDNVLPFEVFTALMNHMKIKFQSIATIDFQIKTRKPILTNESILDYWETVVQRSNISSPLVLSLFAKHTPVVLDNKVVISVENEITKNHLADNYLSIIQQNYLVLGFPSFQITIEVDEAASEARMAQYLARKQEQDEMLVKQAEEAIKQNQQDRQRSDGSQSKGSNNGPLLIGRQISSKEEIKQMASITEEERSVVIEGYIFDSEIRELRSGRKLLVFKMTDYTSSFSVKLFSSNETDEQNFELVKKGIWVRVRGSVQEDTFMRDLVVNGRDVNEVAHAERKDRAPEDEKKGGIAPAFKYESDGCHQWDR